MCYRCDTDKVATDIEDLASAARADEAAEVVCGTGLDLCVSAGVTGQLLVNAQLTVDACAFHDGKTVLPQTTSVLIL